MQIVCNASLRLDKLSGNGNAVNRHIVDLSIKHALTQSLGEGTADRLHCEVHQFK